MSFKDAFFPLGPPPNAEAPNDLDIIKIIEQLVTYAAKNGPSFIQTVWSNQCNNPDYAFLNSDNNLYPYFRSKLWEEFERLEKDSKEPLPEHLRDSWLKLLRQLNGSELSVKKCQGWFMSFSQHSSGLSDVLATEVYNASDPDKVMNLFCVVDDILHRICNDTSKGAGIITSFEPRINAMLEKAYILRDIDLSERLKAMIYSWSKKEIFPLKSAEEMIQYLNGSLRTTMGSEVDTSWFPVGLIPDICRGIQDTNAPYTPIDPEDISSLGQPDIPAMDEYLSGRINCFYDIIQDYKPGVTYDQISIGLSTQYPGRKAGNNVTSSTPIEDGSCTGVRERLSAKGLGYDRSIGQDKTNDDFRTMRKYALYTKKS